MVVVYIVLLALTALAAAGGGYFYATKKQKALLQVELGRRSALTRAASHELKTPLSSITGLIKALKRDLDKLPGRERKAIQDISDASSTLNKMLLEVVDIFDLPENKLKLVMQKTNATEVVFKAVESCWSELAEKYSRLKFEFEAESDVWVKTDPIRLRQCVTALLMQAAEQSKIGKVTVKISSKQTETSDKKFIVQIRDESAGMDDWATDKYFVPEQYEKNPFLRGRPAAMLSMNHAKGIAMRMGGDITAESKVRAGVTFTLWITAEFIRKSAREPKELEPLQLAPPPARQEPETPQQPEQVVETEKVEETEPPKKAAKPAKKTRRPEDDVFDAEAGICDLRGRSVLVVDDNETNLMVLEAFIDAFNADTIVKAENGHDALDCFNAQHFDLVFTDIQMPEMDGYELASKIRASGPHGATVPIVAVSAGNRAESEPKCRAVGINDYIEKPIDEEALMEVIFEVAPKAAEFASNIDQTVSDQAA